MSAVDARDSGLLASYEPLVRSTALLIVSELRRRADPDDDLDDVMQLLRMKVWRALGYFDAAKARRRKGESVHQARDRFVFMCLTDARKDIAKRKRSIVVMIEDWAPFVDERVRDAFDAKYLAQTSDEVFAAVDEPPPLVPNTLTELERAVMLLLYRDYTHREIAVRLGASKGEVSSAVRALRAKFADWRPASCDRRVEIAV